ncbi:hypothetical protein ALO80_101658 [Pseudomonas caricapapayae]|uniref:Uncharacterized protein n=1 Tax=Pseudomonas caricapapayae TaxID=46678 RepID=A0A0P9K398_9PSED|nr:hypothetical protein ALO80_101658 [Pseudomonas caricapapayae]RMM13510.1 hypothetical protein ALQ84_101440 [Pseudomonas caricapapayae]RMV94650.1 hypothetical protein ALP01_101080 [Pseudomonas caricapapayae]
MQQPPQPTQENFVSIVSMTLSEVRAGRQQLVVRRADAAEEASCAPAACRAIHNSGRRGLETPQAGHS